MGQQPGLVTSSSFFLASKASKVPSPVPSFSLLSLSFLEASDLVRKGRTFLILPPSYLSLQGPCYRFH